ncbi:hypothetical protein BH11CYA1_BH11CYA1_46900 [soil metagenome]
MEQIGRPSTRKPKPKPAPITVISEARWYLFTDPDIQKCKINAQIRRFQHARNSQEHSDISPFKKSSYGATLTRPLTNSSTLAVITNLSFSPSYFLTCTDKVSSTCGKKLTQ